MEKSWWQISDFGLFKLHFSQKLAKLWIYWTLFSTMPAPNHLIQNANLCCFSSTFQLCTLFWTKEKFEHLRFCEKHNKLNNFAISKCGNCLHYASRSGMHLVYVYNLPGMILCFEWKQDVWILLPPLVPWEMSQTIPWDMGYPINYIL